MAGSGSPRPQSALEARAPRAKPDPKPMRLLLGFVGLTSAVAFTTAMLPSVAPADAAAAGLSPDSGSSVAADTAPQVVHVKRYVTLEPGQTAPPQSTVVVPAQPAPQATSRPKAKPRVVTRTRQSG